MATKQQQWQQQLEGQQSSTGTHRKLVILCIHGFRQNAKQFKVSFIGFGALLNDSYLSQAALDANIVMLCMP